MTDTDSSDPTVEELLRSRVVDRCASLRDWDHLEQIGHTDPLLWHRLARDLRLDREVGAAMAPALAAADGVPPAGTGSPSARFGVRGLPLLGWAAALVFGLLWWSSGDRPSPAADPAAPGTARGETPGVRERIADGPSESPAPTSTGTSAGTSAGTLPGRLVRATPEEGGSGVRVVYVHRELRETVVDDGFHVTDGEALAAIPIELFETPTEF